MTDAHVKGALATLAVAGIVGLFKLAFAVTALSAEVASLRRDMSRLERTATWYHGDPPASLKERDQ